MNLANTSQGVSIEELRAVLPNGLRDSEIHRLNREGLLELQTFLQLGDCWGHPRLPLEWCPRGYSPSAFACNISTVRKEAQTEIDLELAIVTGTRMLLTCLVCPANGKTDASGQGGGFLAPTTAIGKLKVWLKILRKALSRPCTGNGLLSRVSLSDFSDVSIHIEMRRFQRLASFGYWSDIPTKDTRIASTTSSNLGEKESPHSVPSPDPYKPLPDQFVHYAGRHTAWIVEHLAPTLLGSLEELVESEKIVRPLHDPEKLRKERTKQLTLLLKVFSWPSLASPLPLAVPTEKQEVLEWPPRNWSQCAIFLRLVQLANHFLLALSAGPRASEILSFNADCVIQSSYGTAAIKGKTYKIVERVDGEERDWPMPDLAVQGARQQQRLTMLIEVILNSEFNASRLALSEMPLWRAMGRGNGFSLEPLGSNLNRELRWYAWALDCEQYLDEQALTNHRFRKTLARIVAIALVRSPELLMDIFGHKTLEMTLSYILTDPLIVADMRSAREELVKMTAKDALANADHLGGPAAEGIKRAAASLHFRKMQDYGAETLDELAEELTYGGRTWMFVREAVVCTKGLGQSGPCAVGSVVANPANCEELCDHRLEMPAGRAQAELAISRCIEKITAALSQSDLPTAEIWQDNLRRNLSRFEDLQEKWKVHPVVADALA